MDKSVEIIKEIVNKLKDQNDSEKELFEELNKVIEKYEKDINYRANISDEDLIYKFLTDDSFCPQNITIYEDLKPFDVVTMGYYNEKIDSFEPYPFRVIYKDEDKIELLGLKFLGYGDWNSIKDMKFRFIFDFKGINTPYKLYTGYIPDRDRLIEIRDNYFKENNKNNYNLIATGTWYWTKTKYEDDDSNACSGAWYVSSDGGIYSYGTSGSLGALPYVVIDL